MKKTLLLLSVLCSAIELQAQNGLENLVVETYYISDANDSNADADGGILPVGSVTYRIYADMLPGYRFQAVYGITGHPMRIETSTLFWNNEDRGATTPTFTKAQADDNTVMLDSWLSVGAACTNNHGIMKQYDDGIATAVNSYSPMVLQNSDPAAGIPLTQEDGFIIGQAGNPEPVTVVGISTEIGVFDAQNDGTNGPLFYSDNGSWASLNGSVGPDTIDNKVLIAQITTDGTFSFELNIQIGTPAGGVENYVAANPIGNEIQASFLTFSTATGIQQAVYSQTDDFIIYPNPAHNVMSVVMQTASNRAGFYTIYLTDGRVLEHKTINAGIRESVVDVSSLPAGSYILGVTVDGHFSARPFVKY